MAASNAETALRGVGIAPRGTGVAPRGVGIAPRGTGVALRGVGIALGLALALRVPSALGAVPPPTGLPIALDAQSADVDLASNNVLFRKVRISQGTMSISADQGQGTKQTTRLDFDNSLWVFRGNVKITVDQGQLTSEDAEINFFKQRLAKAVANGKPAAFEERSEKTGKVAHGTADTIDYDAAKGIVRLLKNAWLSNGDTEIRGESLRYNVLAQSIVAEGSGEESQRVHIVITPPPQKP
jgi:lipopolysaccharide export system protein LptA